MTIGSSIKGNGRLVRLADAEHQALDETARELLGLAVERVLAAAEDLARKVVETCARDVPGYRTAPDVAREVEAAFTEHAAVLLHYLASQEDPETETLTALASLGVQRRVQGIPLASLQQAYGIGKRVVLCAVIEELWTLFADENQRRTLILYAIERSLALTGRVSAAFARHYTTSQDNDGMAASGSVLESLLGSEFDEHELRSSLEGLGFVPENHQVVAVVGAPESSARLEESLLAAADSIRDRLGIPAKHIEVTSGGQVIVVFEQNDSYAELAAALEACLAEARASWSVEFVAGVGRAEQGFAGIPVSYEQARLAFEVRSGLWGIPLAMTYHDANLYVLIGARPDMKDELTHLLSPLLMQQNGDELLRCLHAYLDAGGRRGRALGIAGVSRRTLDRRLDEIRQLTGWDLDDGEMRLTLALALRALILSGGGPWHPPLPTPDLTARRRARIALVPDRDEDPPDTEAG